MKKITWISLRRRATYELDKLITLLCGKKVQYITTNMLCDWVKQWNSSLQKYDVYVGIPRSGLIPAAILSWLNHVPFGTVDSVRENIGFMADDRLVKKFCAIQMCEPYFDPLAELKYKDNMRLSDPSTVLLIDDSVGRGLTINYNYDLLKTIFPKSKIDKAAVIVKQDHVCDVDYFFKTFSAITHFLEFDLPDTKQAKVIVSDLDGVLCKDVISETVSSYVSAKPKFIPKWSIDAIITARREEFYDVTRNWLKKNKVKHTNLYMGKDVFKKAQIAKKMRANYIFESDFSSAIRLWNMTRIPVLCFDKNTMISR
jgi:hypoxanthine phosphoribosyltransferase